MSYNVYSSLGHGPWEKTPPPGPPPPSRPARCWFLLVCGWAQPPTARGRQGPARAAAPTPVQRSGHHGPTALLIVKHFRSARSMENNRPPGTRLTIVRCEKVFQIRGRPPGVLAETPPPHPSPQDVPLPNAVFSIKTALRMGNVRGGTEHPTSACFQEAAARPK